MGLSEADIQPELDRRKPGTSRHVTQRQESDTVEILSGVYEGRTTGKYEWYELTVSAGGAMFKKGLEKLWRNWLLRQDHHSW